MAIKPEWSPVPYVGSFQKGRLFSNGMPRETAWTQLSRFGTVENLRRICELRGVNPEIALKASLRLQQASEFRRASQGTSILSRPLLLYYSALNMVRALLLAMTGDMGGYSHGLSYHEGDDLLSTGAKIGNSGTFVTFGKALRLPLDSTTGKISSLQEFLAHIPELFSDRRLLGNGGSSVVRVHVTAYFDPSTPARLTFAGSGPAEDFSARWTEMFPGLASKCRFLDSYTLEVASPLNNDEDVSQFCYENLQDNLYWLDEGVWWATVHQPAVVPWPRLMAYLGSLFVLASVVRYEPELLNAATQTPSDSAYLLASFMDHAERLLPQMILAVAETPRLYFV